ncbi:MAG: PPC domain-containing DNA-binding protein [Lautropia sp.]
MKAKVLNEGPERTIALVFDRADEPLTLMRRFVAEHAVSAARISGIGAFERAVVGYFDWQRKDYRRIDVPGQVEVLSMLGDVALDGGTPAVHLHVVLGRADGSTVGGHLLEASVRPTLEVVLVESPAWLRKRHDPESGLALIDLGGG